MAEPTRQLRQVSVITNTVFGVGMTTVGVLLRSKPLAVIGIVGLAGAAAMVAVNASLDAKKGNC